MTHGNCDESTLNGCETDLRKSVRHCGACGRACAGLCTSGECLAFELMAPGQFLPETIALAPDYAFLAARDAVNLLHILRVSRWTGQVDTLSAPDPWLQILDSAVGTLRVYVSDVFELKSFALDGSDPRNEGVAVENLAAQGGSLYYSSLGGLYEWSETDRKGVLLREFPGATGIELAASVVSVLFAVNYSAGSEPAHYEIYDRVPQLEPALIAAGSGVVTELVAGWSGAYFLVRNGDREELRATGDGESILLEPDAVSLVELSATNGGVFATRLETAGPMLRFYANATPIRYEWQTHGELLRPTGTLDGELWFVDSSRAALMRLQWPGEFP